jgi:GDP-D-mannose dehydratase
LARLYRDRSSLFPSDRGRELIADASKAKEKLGWEAKTKFYDLVKIMMDAELRNYGLKK